MRNYDDETVNQKMELLCATFIYEPYLYPKIKKVLPDIICKIESFVDYIIFGKDENRVVHDENKLFYKWDKKDVVHLFFIVYKGNLLLEKLKETTDLKKLVEYLGETDGSINYIWVCKMNCVSE